MDISLLDFSKRVESERQDRKKSPSFLSFLFSAYNM
jgi:hypothetical protein